MAPVNRWLPFALVPLVLGALCLGPCVPHQLYLVAMERQYRAVVHPPDSRVLAEESDLGLLEGNGNHCDYFVGELRVFRQPLAELQAFYGPGGPNHHLEAEAPHLYLEVHAAAPSAYVFSPRDRLNAAASHATVAPGEALFIVYAFDQQPPGGDFRCH